MTTTDILGLTYCSSQPQRQGQTEWSGEYFLCPNQPRDITSPNYPSNYDDNLIYNWTFSTYPGNLLLLTFYSFHLEPDCFDYVLIDDGNTTVKYCETDFPPDTLSTSNRLIIMFRTDSSGQRNGFFGNITVYNETEGFCADFEYDFNGWTPDAHSPVWQRSNNSISNSSSGHSGSNRNYYIYIDSSDEQGYVADIQFSDLPTNWKYASIQFYYYISSQTYTQKLQVTYYLDGFVEDFIVIHETASGGWKFASAIFSNSLIPNILIRGIAFGKTSSKGLIVVDDIFVSESFEGQTEWSFEYFLYPNQSKNITSPHYHHQNKYDDNLSYNWTFRTYPGHLLLLTFFDFYVEEFYDYVSVDDGGTLVRYDGQDLPPDTLSINNTLIVKFSTDNSGQRRGFSSGIKVYNGRMLI
ncbi:CUB domain-containing protein 2-like [Antedon mediterranea]|uniref:CUB domain-containing protein 2-like n=1 Tax=Antedon mediterranea TaxID=105859 RepID=UPI003AF60976